MDDQPTTPAEQRGTPLRVIDGRLEMIVAGPLLVSPDTKLVSGLHITNNGGGTVTVSLQT